MVHIKNLFGSLIRRKYSFTIKEETKKSIVPIKINNSNNDGPLVLIIGAGIAGLSAAECLIKNGIKNIKILEASRRIGGRIYSVNFGDTICEIGAKCISENDDTDSLYKLTVDENLPISQLSIKKKHCLIHNGGFIDENIVQSTALNFNYLLNTIPLSSTNNQNFEKNSRKYLQNETQKIIEKYYKKTRNIVEKIFSVYESDLSSFFGSDLSVIHTNHLKKMAMSFTKPLFISSGLSKIIEKITRKLDENQILLGKPIETIHWKNLQTFETPIVYCLDGSKYVTDHIIFTLPLGPLKVFHHLFFNPVLPKQKLQAIFALGYGCPVKIYLLYTQNVSKWLPDIIKPIWGARLINDELDWWHGITEFAIVPNSEKVIEVKVNGAISGIVEHLNHQQISEKVTNVLRRFIGRYDIPSPNEILCSTWGTDVKYFGGIPFLSTLSDENNINQLAAPLFSNESSNMPVLLFAGDATISEGFGTLDGARKSGIREAMRIVKIHKKQLN